MAHSFSSKKASGRPSSPTSTLSSGTTPARIIPARDHGVLYVDPNTSDRPDPIIFNFDSDDAHNNALRTPDGKAQYLITTPKRSNNTQILGRRDATIPGASAFSTTGVDRLIATIVRSRWKSDKVSFGEGPPSDINKLFKTTKATDLMSEIDRVTFSDETDRRYEWRGAHVFRALQLWTVDQPQLLVAQFRFPDGGKPQLILEPPHEGFANIDMIIVTFLLLDRDRKRGERRSDLA
ncbi:hypothetical protein FRC14_006777 [Serendipita sp. 396]|nr:hypothetical protein FRC14_006777 [Serendipita sp. 396]KAG8824424.1 hypothetical protein FRC18_010534 [Serendipita sp. 400]